nr:phage tail tape measure protein [Escherichia coli]
MKSRIKTPSMSLPEASDNEGRTRAALTEQNRLIDEQASRVKSLQEKIAGYQYVLANWGWTTGDGFMIKPSDLGEDRNGRACSGNRAACR